MCYPIKHCTLDYQEATIERQTEISFRKQMEVDMLRTVHGRYRAGKIELAQQPNNVSEDTPVIVTFLESGLVDLRTYGFDKVAAAELRARLATFAED
jgi:hypothetical protein